MSGPRGPLLIISVVLAAFIFGYKQDSLVNAVRSKFTEWQTPTPTQPPPSAAIAPEQGRPTAPGTPPSGPFPPGPGMPAAGGAPAKQPSLAQSLDSVTAGQVEPKQEERRNLYFEKLSEQLRELRGENPPTADAPQAAPPPPPAPPLPEETVAEDQETSPDEDLEPDNGADLEDEEPVPGEDEEPEEE